MTELSEKAFEVMKEVITSKSNPVLGLATGSSPIGLYQKYDQGSQGKRDVL